MIAGNEPAGQDDDRAQRHHFEKEVIPWGVRWYVAYPISYRQLEEMLEERGVEVDHAMLNRWVIKYAPLLERQFRARKRPVGSNWRLDETYVKVREPGNICIGPSTRSARRLPADSQAVSKSRTAVPTQSDWPTCRSRPEKITIDKSGANTAAIENYNA